MKRVGIIYAPKKNPERKQTLDLQNCAASKSFTSVNEDDESRHIGIVVTPQTG